MTLVPHCSQCDKTRFIACVLTLSLSLCLPFSAWAKTAPKLSDGSGPTNPRENSNWGIGLAAISNQQSIQGIDRDTMVIPIITYESEYIRWFGPNIDIKLPSIKIDNEQEIEFSLSAGFDFGGYDKDEAQDTPILQGMDERKGAFGIGAQVNWKTRWGNINAKWMTDVSGDREGNSVTLVFEKSWFMGQKVMFSPHIAAIWLDDNFVDFHYGVRSYEVKSNRPAFIGEATANIKYGLRAAYLFDQQNSIMLDFSITSLGSEIKKSPLVDSSTENNLLLFYMYKF